jgi:N-hydroxyarylamine O-acetyltransferase
LTSGVAELQLAHLNRVPFENLDIHRDVAIVLDLEAIFDKVVARRRGGYCYELNSLFGALLTAVGYRVDLVAARVASDGGLGPEFAHMALLVQTDEQDVPLLVDVGFGDAFTAPLPLIGGAELFDRDRLVRLTRHGSQWAYEEDRGSGWHMRYAFMTQPRQIADFQAMNVWQQTSPDSHFTAQAICSMLSADGRVTISGNRLIVTSSGERVERELLPSEIEATLRDRFGIEMPHGG